MIDVIQYDYSLSNTYTNILGNSIVNTCLMSVFKIIKNERSIQIRIACYSLQTAW